jgi:ABC-type antimicrobial peptide transport system permease subunit
MKIDALVVGLIVIVFGALLLADAILTTVDPASMLFSPNDVKGMVGVVLVVISAFYFKRAKG